MRGARHFSVLRSGSARAGYAFAMLGVTLMTAAIELLPGHGHIANLAMLYLLVVIGTAMRFGSGPAVFASVLSFLAFDWFFVQPLHTFTVSDIAEWLALLTFLVTAVVTGQLTGQLRAHTDEARRRERETAALAEASWAVASQVGREQALSEVLRRMGEVVPLREAAILLRDPDGSIGSAAWQTPDGRAPEPVSEPHQRAVQHVLQHGRALGWPVHTAGWDRLGEPERGSNAAYLPLVAEDRVLGVLSLALGQDHTVTAQERKVVESLANHAAVVLERDRLSRAETEARALVEADRLKTALLSMVSHDFRSPLAGIKASVSSLLEPTAVLDPATQHELLRGIDVETDRLSGMVGNILALSRLESGAWRPQREATHLDELVGSTLATFSKEENARVRVSVATVREALLDPVQMVQVLRNLLENALKYSPAGSEVELRVRDETGDLLIEVLDRGPGLPPGDEARLFEPFYRAPALRESAHPGVGLGLAVCRGLVEAHHGTLTAHNREGGGAVFSLRLPRCTDG